MAWFPNTEREVNSHCVTTPGKRLHPASLGGFFTRDRQIRRFVHRLCRTGRGGDTIPRFSIGLLFHHLEYTRAKRVFERQSHNIGSKSWACQYPIVEEESWVLL